MASVVSSRYDRSGCKGSSDELSMGTYEVRYIIHTDGPLGPKAVYAGAQALSAPNNAPPALWTTYAYETDTDSYSWARAIEVERDPNSEKTYYLTVRYLPALPGEGPRLALGAPINSVVNPVARDPVIWWDREVFTTIALYDKDGKAIVNKCQDYYPDDIDIEFSRGVLVVEKNVASMNDVMYYQNEYDGAVNSTSWAVPGTSPPVTLQPRRALCREVSAGPPETEQGYFYFHLLFRFAIKPAGKTWDERKPEYGQFHWTKDSFGNYETLNQGNQIHRAFTDAKALVPLNEDGTRRPHDQPTLVTEWRVRREVDFNQLPF